MPLSQLRLRILEIDHHILQCERTALVPNGLQISGVAVVGGAQMNAIQCLCCFQSLLPLARGLVEAVEQVKALTVLVQPFCVFLLRGKKHEGKVTIQTFRYEEA